MAALKKAAALLGIEDAQGVLGKALTNRTVSAGFDTMVKPLNRESAVHKGCVCQGSVLTQF